MRITVALIVECAAEFFSVAASDITSSRRTRPLVAARHTACFLARKMTGKSYPEIGRLMGGLDHTTVMGACASIETMLRRDVKAGTELSMLEGIINAAAGAITHLNFELPKDIDARAVAQRLISQPLTQFTLSIEEVKAMAFAVLSEPVTPEPETMDSPSPVPSEPVSPTEGRDSGAALLAASRAVVAAHARFENERFSRGESAALNRFIASVKGLQKVVETGSAKRAMIEQERGI
jgi:Bacterial dnaA protein helix-turn-helix